MLSIVVLMAAFYTFYPVTIKKYAISMPELKFDNSIIYHFSKKNSRIRKKNSPIARPESSTVQYYCSPELMCESEYDKYEYISNVMCNAKSVSSLLKICAVLLTIKSSLSIRNSVKNVKMQNISN